MLFLMLCLVASGVALAQTPAASDRAAPAWDGTYRRIRVPILMYHYVSAVPEDADEYRTDLSVSPDMFRAHMDYLSSQSYTTISLYQLDNALLTGALLPDKPVILTFDDGYLDHYANVYPTLQQHGFIGTFFIITNTADDEDPNYLSWTQIHEMAQAGMDMESHTKTHSDLRGRDFDFLVYELLGSRQSLEAHTSRVSHMLAYPSGHYDDMVLSVLKTMPVWRAVTTENGAYATTDNRLELPRLRIHDFTGVEGLKALLDDS